MQGQHDVITPQDILDYWLRELGEAGWYAAGEALDAAIRERFEPAWHLAQSGALSGWQASPEGALAFLILTDQLPRNMFRGTAASFASDALARSAAYRATSLGWDLRIAEPERSFFYMPFMHSEIQADQNRSVSLFVSRTAPGPANNLLHARAHREVIRQFGRFPTRNLAFCRTDTPAEADYLARGGYGEIVRKLRG